MKNIFKVLLVLSIIITTYSCSDRDMPYEPEFSNTFKVELEGGKNAISAEGGTLKIIIQADTNGWWTTMTDGVNWSRISKKFGAGDYILPVTIDKNNTGEARSVTVRVHCTYDLPPVDLVINQEK